jgi:hypothetical protein
VAAHIGQYGEHLLVGQFIDEPAKLVTFKAHGIRGYATKGGCCPGSISYSSISVLTQPNSATAPTAGRPERTACNIDDPLYHSGMSEGTSAAVLRESRQRAGLTQVELGLIPRT